MGESLATLQNSPSKFQWLELSNSDALNMFRLFYTLIRIS